MKTERNILAAFILNLLFSVFELVGGMMTGSVAIMSDAVHDAGDAASIGLSYFLERKSRRQPDETYTYGYARYSVLGGVITTLILLVGSAAVIINAVARIITPVAIDYRGMIIFAVIGVLVNLAAAWMTREGDSINQKAVNLHMLEDVAGWGVVLAGAVVMHFTDFALIDPLMSIGVSLFIFIHAVQNLKEAADVFLEKTPHEVDTHELAEHIETIPGVHGVHHMHLWTMDGQSHYATLHVVAEGELHDIKAAVREEMREHGVHHVTIELEAPGEHCHEEVCRIEAHDDAHCGHHHHHHHGHHHHHAHH